MTSCAKRSSTFLTLTNFAGQIRNLAKPWLQSAFHALADFALPLACVSCHRLISANDSGLVCGQCWTRVNWLPHPRCDRCGHPSDPYTCRWCQLLPPFVRSARSCCWVPGGVAADLIYALKYLGWASLASGLASEMARLSWPPDVEMERSLLVPVPLTAERLRERGYNQSTHLAQELATFWRVPMRECLARIRSTQTQTQLTPGERLHNVAGAFTTIVPKSTLARQHIILVDDVVTTAATLNSCAAALYENGARIISYVTFGRARAAGDRL